MILGSPQEARWHRSAPRRTLDAQTLQRIVQTALPRQQVREIGPLTDGWRNANFKLGLGSAPEVILLRIYEHDASLCQKEVDLIRLLEKSVPVPELIYAEPSGLGDIPPFTLARYIDGISFHELKRSGDIDAIAQAAFSVGEILANIGRVTFSKSGWLGPGPRVAGPLLEGSDQIPRFIDLCLVSPQLQHRMAEDLRDRVHEVVWSRKTQFADLENEACLVHGDFGKRNVLVRSIGGRWVVVGVIDWEFAISGSPLADMGHFLRYEQAARPLIEPHFSNGYLHAGGRLPMGWHELARLVDLTALCESLTHDDLPDAVSIELVELVRATVENRDPQ
jgi:aminoglycoside phosphotransferase (APT) family kinase protein